MTFTASSRKPIQESDLEEREPHLEIDKNEERFEVALILEESVEAEPEQHPPILGSAAAADPRSILVRPRLPLGPHGNA